MATNWLRAAATALLVLGAARAEESVLDLPVEKEGWPTELVHRPLTLAKDMLEVAVPVNIDWSKDRFGKPVFVSPSVYYGVADGVTVGIRHFLGLCLSGSSNGCPNTYNDVSLDSIWRLARSSAAGGLDLALGAALNAAPLTDPFTLSVEGRIIAKWAVGPLALALAPAFNVGITERDTSAKTAPLAFPLATYPFGWVQGSAGNKEFMSIPATVQVQIVPQLAVSLAAALDGPLDPAVGNFSDYVTIPVGAVVAFTPVHDVDVGVSFTFLNLLGKRPLRVDALDNRGLQVFAAFRR